MLNKAMNNYYCSSAIKFSFIAILVIGLAGFAVACGGNSSPEPTIVPLTPMNKQAYVNIDTAPMRLLPDADAQQIGSLRRGSEITAVGVSSNGSWYLVYGSGIEGEVWILKEFVTIGTVQPEETEAFTSTNTTVVIEKPTGTKTGIPTLLSTITPTQSSVTTLIITKDDLCYAGPGDVYEVVSTVLANEQLDVVGIGEDNNYFVVINPIYKDNCWVKVQSVQFDGVTENLEVIEIPPLPTKVKILRFEQTPRLIPISTPSSRERW